jgi:hypothetical protein
MMRECPVCWKKWASKESKVASWRFWTGAKYVSYRRMIGRREARKIHCVVSFPARHGIDWQRKKALRIIKRHGLIGGLMVYHPFRQDEGDDFVPDGYVHFHVLALAQGDIPPGGTDGGAIFKHIPHPDGHCRGFQSVDEVRACTFYLLTHCGILEGRHALTWWGAMSYNQLPVGTLDANYEGRELYCRSLGHACPSCGSMNTEPFDNAQDLGFRSCEPIRHGWLRARPSESEYFLGRAWGRVNDAI